MDFEQYLEKDILIFLDSKMAKKENTNIGREEEYGLYLTKDYLKELNYALDNDELTRAKKLFDELKANYTRLPKNSVERKKIYTLLERMYEKIQHYVRIKEGRIEIIKEGGSEIYKDRTDKFTDINEKKDKPTIVDNSEQEFDFSRKTELPFRLAGSKPVKDETKTDSSLGQKEDRNAPSTSSASSVESNITGSTIKDVNADKDSKAQKYYEDKSVKEEDKYNTIETQNAFTRGRKGYQKTDDYVRKEPLKYSINASNETYIEETDEEILDQTSDQLERLVSQITKIILGELNKRIEEKRNEENQKIENIRKEITRQMVDELNKKLQDGENEAYKDVSGQAKRIRKEILSNIYHQAPHIVTSGDNIIENLDKPDEDENADSKSFEIADNDRYNFPRNDLKGSEDNNDYLEIQNDDLNSASESVTSSTLFGDKLRAVYEQAIYLMFENKYEDAARLFQNIIAANPTNKAARIRLEECIEKYPELANISDNGNSIDISSLEVVDNEYNSIQDIEKEQDTDSNDDEDSEDDLNEFNYADDNNNNTNELASNNIDSSEQKDANKIIISSNKPAFLKHKYTDEELQRMYEEAIYVMFQSNYDEAARLFQQILKARPENKAARIRLSECLEAIGNA